MGDNGHSLSHIYQWIQTVDTESGRPVVLGPYNDENEANRVGFEKLGGNFEVIPLRTRDVGLATRILKHRRFMQTEQLSEALKRARHKI